MPIRNGIRTVVRAGGRAALFALLILTLTLSLTLGMGMWIYCDRLLNQFDTTYTSIVLAEYIGEDYPDANVADEEARRALDALDDDALADVEGVVLWEQTENTLASLAGYTRSSGSIPYGEYGVIVATGLSASEDDDTGRISQVLYTREGKEGVLAVFDAGDTDFAPERGKKYLLHGQFVNVSANRTFVVTDFYEDCETKPWLELSGDDDPALSNGLFAETAERYRMANNAVLVTASDDIAALEPFQQGLLYLEAGRFPLAGEAGVCLLSGSTAQRLGVGVGDRVDVAVLQSALEDRYELTDTGDGREWEIVGVSNVRADYEGCLWVSGAEGSFPGPLYGYELGRAVLDNRSAVRAVETLDALMPSRVRLTLYDQGYSAAAKPIWAMRSTAMAVTAAIVCGTLAVLFLFAYLFVGSQRGTVQALVSLGTPRGKIRLWLLSGAGLLAAASAILGAVLGHFLLDGVIHMAVEAAEALYTSDTRYSDAALGLIRDVPETGTVPVWVSAIAGMAVVLAALLLCLVFLRQVQMQDFARKGRISVRVPKGGTSLFGQGAVRFALLSAKRGGWRSAVVSVAAFVLTLLLSLLAVGAAGWEEQLKALYEDSVLEGQMVSTNGRNATKLTVSALTVRRLWRSGYLSGVDVSLNWNYWVDGEMPDFASNSFGLETQRGWISRQSELTAANSLDAIPEFYYNGRPEIQWLKGWDESFLAGSEAYSILRVFTFGGNGSTVGGEPMPIYPILASNGFLESHHLQLGDETEILVWMTLATPRGVGDIRTVIVPVSVQIVGSFQQTGKKANLYVPLSFWCDPDWITGAEDMLAEGERPLSTFRTAEERDKFYYNATNFRSCRFTLNSAYDLEPFRQFLAEEEFSQVGQVNRNRTTVLLQDQVFQETVSGLERYIAFGRILFPALYLAVALLGFIISWLMINGRRMEFAILRGLGASRERVFATFFLEQMVLCLTGCLTGALALTVLRPLPAIWLAAAGFLGCYLVGCALSVRMVGRTKLITLLSERE